MQRKTNCQDLSSATINSNDIIVNQYNSWFNISQLNIVNSSEFQQIIKLKNDANNILKNVINMTTLPTLTTDELKQILTKFWNKTKNNEICQNTKILWFNFVISNCLDVIQYQKYQLQNILNINNQVLLSKLLIPHCQQLVNEYLPLGPPLNEVPIKKLGLDAVIDFHYLFDMQQIKKIIMLHFWKEFKNKGINEMGLKLSGNHDGKYNPQIKINQVKLLLAVETFQLQHNIKVREKNKSYYYTLYEMNDFNMIGPIMKDAHQITMKVFAIPTIIISHTDYIMITGQRNKLSKQRIMNKIVNSLIQKMAIDDEQGELIISLDIEFTTSYAMKHIFRKDLPININIYGTGINCKTTLTIPNNLKLKYYKIISNLKRVKKNYNATKNNNKESKSSWCYESYLHEKLYGHSPLITQTFHVPSSPIQQQNMIWIQILLSKYKINNKLFKPRLSMQSNNVENLMIMNFLTGQIRYAFQEKSCCKKNSLTTKQILNIESKYHHQKYLEIINSCHNDKQMAFDIYHTQNSKLSFNIIDILLFTQSNENKCIHPTMNYPVLSSDIYKLKRIENTDTLIVFDKKQKTIYVNKIQNKHMNVINNLLITLNAIPKILFLQKTMNINKQGNDEFIKRTLKQYWLITVQMII